MRRGGAYSKHRTEAKCERRREEPGLTRMQGLGGEWERKLERQKRARDPRACEE